MNEQIKLLRDTIAGKFGAKQIFLFGSHASGKAREESDIDLCVIADLKNKRKIDLITEIRRELIDRISSPLDILVYNEEEFNERARLRTTLEHKILSDGVKVYG
jgi:predicted nucleotidyltransferase